ncbi:MAG: 2Fe-2S iron-sulfur cluster-binding protein, partial [Pyrinomonadaceae bacterium]
AMTKLAMQGDFDLKDQIDSSHRFLYGHRFWKTVKEEIENRAASFDGKPSDLKMEIEQIAKSVSEKAKADKSLTLGISAIGLMTLNQVGLEAFKSVNGETEKPKGLMTSSPDKIVAERAKDASQGIFGFLKTIDKTFTVSWEDKQSKGKFALKNQAELATASALDQTHNWKERDERCWEGVIPVECRSASCGTCWVGILAGEEKLSEVQRLERKQMKVFGYNQPDEAKPFLRLACQAKGLGNVSIVIPAWNGVFGKKVYDNIADVELEPVTTSAKKLRETIATAASED